MADTGYARTMAAARRYRANLSDRHATSTDWETLEIWQVTPPTDQPWHVAAYVTADVDAGVVAQLRLRTSGAVAPTGTGAWRVSSGRLLTPTGEEFISTGFNGGAPVALGQFGSSAGEYVAWALEGFPPFTLTTDIWPGDANLWAGQRVFPGGHINGGRYWSNELNTWADLPDRVYALTGVRSADAIAKGIAQPADSWRSRLYRMVAYLRSGAFTWEAGKTADQTVPEYIERVQELVALGLVVAIECHDFTNSNTVLPAGLVADPMLAVASVADGPVRDLLKLIDAFAAAFPGGGHNAWFCLPNEPYTTGRSTDYDNFIVTLARRLRGKGFAGVISLPLARYGQGLRELAEGGYASLITTLASTYNLGPWVWEFHNYGKRWSSGGVATTYTYAEMDADLAACRAAGHAVWMGEYGQGAPAGTSSTGDADADREGVKIVATDTYGTPLGVKYPWVCPTWWAIADHTFDHTYSLTYGAANYGNENGPNPNSVGAPNKGVMPMWDIDGSNLDWLTPGGLAHWELAHTIVGASDADAVGVSPAVTVDGHQANIRLGFEGLTNASQLVYVEGRRVTGTGGVRLLRSATSIVSAPPLALQTSVPPSTGGSGGTTATRVRSSFVSEVESTIFTVLPSWFSPAVQPGDKVVLIGTATGPSDVSSFSWTSFPGTELTSASGGTFNPRVKVTVVDYNAAGWTVSAPIGFRVAAVCLQDAVGLAASTPVQAFSPANPSGVAHDAGAVGLVVNLLNYTTAAVTAPPTSPGTHTTIIDKAGVPRQIHVASIALPTAGTYDPGPATTGPGSEESTAFAIIAQPTAVASAPGAPTIPTFNTGSAITLSTLSADIAAAVAAQPAGTHFKLIAGTYTNWSNVRPKSGMHFQSPSSGQAILEGTGKTWAFRAIDATGSSDNVTISCTGTGSIKIQNYGTGTTRAEYGAIQAQPTDTGPGSTEYTYGVAQNWYIHGVELSKNGAQGIRVSDYFTLHNVVSYGHNVSNVGGDRGVGGLMYGCTLDAGGLNPATGALSNGACAKFTFWNATGGRNQVLPSATLRPKAPMQVVNTNMNATHAGVTGSAQVGLWFDLDCQQIEVYGGTFTDLAWVAMLFEGGNNIYASGFTIVNSDGYGNTNGDQIRGGLSISETTNITVENFTITNSDRALVISQWNRSGDWYNSNNSSFINYAWPASLGGARPWITDTGPLPIPGLADQSNMWGGNATIRNGTFTSCSKVILSEDAGGGGMSTAGSLPLSTIRFESNNYSGSPGILFYDRSLTGINLAAWQALPYKRDN